MTNNIFKKRKGVAALDMIFSIFVIFLVIAIFIKIIPVYVLHAKADTITRDLVREISLKGDTNVSYYISELKSEYNLNDLKVNISPNSSKLDLNQKFYVEVEIKTDFKLLELARFPFIINVKDQGRGEVYRKWKSIRALFFFRYSWF